MEEELRMLHNYGNGSLVPDLRDPFPKLAISPDLKGMSGLLVDLEGLWDLDLDLVGGKVIYKSFIKVFHEVTLNGKRDTMWRGKNLG